MFKLIPGSYIPMLPGFSCRCRVMIIL